MRKRSNSFYSTPTTVTAFACSRWSSCEVSLKKLFFYLIWQVTCGDVGKVNVSLAFTFDFIYLKFWSGLRKWSRITETTYGILDTRAKHSIFPANGLSVCKKKKGNFFEYFALLLFTFFCHQLFVYSWGTMVCILFLGNQLSYRKS